MMSLDIYADTAVRSLVIMSNQPSLSTGIIFYMRQITMFQLPATQLLQLCYLFVSPDNQL